MSKSEKIKTVQDWASVSADVAKSYLDGCDWIVWNACETIRDDREFGALA